MKGTDMPSCLVRMVDQKLPGIYNYIDKKIVPNILMSSGYQKSCNRSIEAELVGLLCAAEFNPMMAALLAEAVTPCYLWRKNQVVFSFDKDLSSALAAQANDLDDTDILPSDLLTHPPYPCTYIETDVFDKFCGFWYWIRPGMAPDVTVLRVQFVAKSMKCPPVGAEMNLLHGKSIRECFDDTITERKESAQYLPPSMIKYKKYLCDQVLLKQMLREMLVSVQFILYLSSENADIQDIPQAEAPKARKKRGKILDKVSEVKKKAVGFRIGSAIRKSRQSSQSSSQGGTGTKVRPHSRRGHWHHYWTGPRDGDRKLILKWTAPTFIHMDEFKNDTVVIHPVKQERIAS